MLTYNQAQALLESIMTSRQDELKSDMIRYAVRYARLRVDQRLAIGDERLAMNPTRSAAHNAFIDCCNALSRAQARAGEDNEWRREITDDRKVIGDFACFIHAILGIQMR